MKCIVLDYSTSIVHIIEVPNEIQDKINNINNKLVDANSIIEDWLNKVFHISQISYMFGDNISVNFE